MFFKNIKIRKFFQKLSETYINKIKTFLSMDAIELTTKEALRRGYSLKTIKTYTSVIKQFFKKFPTDPKKVTKKGIQVYIDCLLEKKVSGNTINIHLNALKFFLQEVLGKRVMIRIKHSKTPKYLPVVLTKQEVFSLISVIENQKHRLAIKLLYSAGLRVSELVHLKVKDLELENKFGWVRKGKGNKDRMFVIAELIKEELKDHITRDSLESDSWLFKGIKQRHLSQKTIHEIIKKAAEKAKIKKNVHAHTLRHSFATHLIENGYDIPSVQFLLGHSSPETTMKYVHMSSSKMISVRSPYDSLKE